MKIRSGLAFCLAVGSSIGLGVSATEADEAVALQEIVVTASRRNENLQKVPISVTALTAETLERSGIEQTSQLAQVTPGLVLARNSVIFQPTIRGVGSRAATAGDESNVAMYVDGVYQPETFAGTFDLLQIDRVEVLRGPQGTLFGRNSTGGLINVITANPKFDTRGSLTLSRGSFGETKARGYVTGGLSDNLAADVAALYVSDDGYVDNLTGGPRLADRRNTSARVKLLWQPSKNFQSVLSVSHADQDDREPVSYEPVNRNTAGALFGSLIASQPWEAALSFIPKAEVKQTAVSLRATLALAALQIESTSGYQDNKARSLTDSDASPADRSSVDNTQLSENFSQELRLQSVGNERFQWQAGVYGFWNTSKYAPFIVRGVNSAISSTLFARNQTKSFALFAEGSFAVTDKIRVVGGARYTDESRHFVATRTGATGLVNGTVDAQVSFNKMSPRASLQYAFTNDTNAYVTWSRGFKSGVFSTGGINPIPVRPETIDAVEVGVKSDVSRRLRVNVSAFKYDYTDIQLSQRDPSGVSILQNAAAATMRGGELELTAVVTKSLEARLGVALLDATFDSFPGAAVTIPLANGAGNSQVFRDVSGNHAIRAPNSTVNLALAYSRDFSKGRLIASTNVFHSAKFYWEYLNRVVQPAFTLVNAQLGWTFPGDRWQVTLSGQNLGDKAVMQNFVTSTLADYAWYGRPRSWALAVKAQF